MLKNQNSPSSHAQGTRLVRELLEASRNLPTSTSELGSIELGSSELKKRIQTHRTSKTPDEANFVKAHYLLAGSGIAIDDLETEIRSIELPNSLSSSILPTAHAANNDFDTQLNNKKEENILAAIEQSLNIATRDFDNFINQNIAIDWKKRKHEIYESFGFETKASKSNTGTKSRSSSKSFSRGFLASASSPLPSSASSSALGSGDASKGASKISNWGKSTIGHSVLGPRLGGGEFTDLPEDAKLSNVNDFALREKFEKYSIIVYQLNNYRQQLKPFPVATCFYNATKGATDSKTKQINECWKIISSLVDESETSILPAQYFLNQYDDLKSKSSTNLRLKIIDKSIKYLENQFLDHINVIYRRKNDDNENEDGLPTNLNKIKHYVKSQKQRLFEKDEISKHLLIINDVPLWALIYYLLRAGCYTEALEVAQNDAVTFKKIDSNFATYLKSFVDSSYENSNNSHSLSSSLQSLIRQEFNDSLKNASDVDPYRYAVYKIIGKCDVSKKSIPKIFQSTEDWLWANFLLLNENSQDSTLSKHESYVLLDFQKNLVQYGASYFNSASSNSSSSSSSSSPIFIHILLLLGLFELAVKHAFSISEIDAVNLAIGLTYYGLLRVSDYDSIFNDTYNSQVSNNLIRLNAKGLYEINYARLIGYYTRSFRVSDAKVALEYLLLINLAGGADDVIKRNRYCKLTLEAIRELVIETKEFALLLGTVNKDGSRYPGRIENRQQLLFLGNEDGVDNKKKLANGGQNEDTGSKSSYLYEIIEQAAKRVSEEGRIYDSLLLYQLSENHSQVISIINRLLGDLLSSMDIFQPISKVNEQEYSLIETGQKLLDTYNLNPSIISSSSKEILKKLLVIASIKITFVNGDFENTLESIKELDLIPIQSGGAGSAGSDSGIIAAIKARCQEINQQQLDYSLMKNLGNLLLISMHCIKQLISKFGHSVFHDAVKEEKINDLQNISKQVMVFAGMIQYKMPKEVYIKLTTLELHHD